MLGRSFAGAAVLAATMLVACGGSPADIEALKKGQKEILAKLESLEKSMAQARTAPAQQRPQIDPNKVYDISTAGAVFKGPAQAKVTIVKFSDYQCPFCVQSAPLVDQVLAAYPKDVNFVYKQFPLTTIHPQAMTAAKASVAAGKQGKFWEMHDALFENSRALSPDKMKELAQKIGLDVPRFEKDMESPEVAAQIDTEMKQARAADVTGTPTFFVNGKRVMNRSVDGFKQMIDAALSAKS